jgi:hypothetical protein
MIFLRIVVAFTLAWNASAFGIISTSTSTITITRSRTTRAPTIAIPLFSQVSENEDPVVQLPLLEAQLANESNEGRREELQSKIDNAQTAGEFGVRKAQVEFYDAFSNQDFGKMENLWAMEQDCQCIHPGMACIDGRTTILRSWSILFQSSPGFEIEPTETQMDICGSTAICRCVEAVGPTSRLEALNIYKREQGAWKMTLHMAVPIAALPEQ